MTQAKTSEGSPDGFRAALRRLRSAQKSAKGAPPYSLYVNRPLGRVFAAAAYQIGLTPNQITGVSAAFTFAGILALAMAPAITVAGVTVALLLIVGYAFDAADGQLARLRGNGTMLGEWLDHMIDAVKVVALHLAVVVSMYRNFDVSPVWLVVPLVFSVASSVHFFGMILIDLLGRLRRARAGVPDPSPASANRLVTVLKLPTDYGVFCLVFLVLGWHVAFLALYTFFAAATAGYTFLVSLKWRRDVIALDALKA